ncbi:hypothetical protein [Desulfurococcus mucosus]|uniref:Uncharacterized protein n=1 Tax=Desulfurococcus mucosus (strain ATCC 35584 / DSM 2162 / JCM 9187 / O7/1) TaxID=765177 RepID=E8R840_DESM0|nr:hypothetical protein [Desulfurococcus mucosus]ADV64666.1 hypothetical protein Desmu_0347 [Desulfurococcus mucosus DSM 2162]
MKEALKCPRCGFTGRPEEFTFMQEATIYYTGRGLEHEERERPIMVICPRCGEGFYLESPVKRLLERLGAG